MAKLDADERRNIAREFKSVVNMSPAALRSWLKSPESRAVGMTRAGEKVTKPADHESVGHEMGRRILDLHAKKEADTCIVT